MHSTNNTNNKCVSKTHISPYAQLIPGGVVHGPLKGTKHICNQCFYTGNFWRWSAHVPPVYRLQTTKGEKLQNCTSHVLAHPVDTWGKIRQYKWHSCTGEIPTFIFGTAYVPIFFVVSEIQGSKLQKLSKKYKLYGEIIKPEYYSISAATSCIVVRKTRCSIFFEN